jgi:hypothetical protein
LQGNSTEQRLSGIAAVFREIGTMHAQAKQGNTTIEGFGSFPVTVGSTNPFELDSFLLSRPGSPTGVMFDWNEFLLGGTKVFFPETDATSQITANVTSSGPAQPYLVRPYETGTSSNFATGVQHSYHG